MSKNNAVKIHSFSVKHHRIANYVLSLLPSFPDSLNSEGFKAERLLKSLVSLDIPRKKIRGWKKN